MPFSKHRLFPIAAWAYALLLTYLLLAPHPLWFLGSEGITTEETVDENVADYVQHALAYAMLGGLTSLATIHRSRIEQIRWIAAAAGHGAVCEILQHFVPDRHFGLHDALANAIGAILGWLIVSLLKRGGANSH